MSYWIIGIIVFIIVCVVGLQIYLSAPVYKGPVSDHFDGKTFINYGNVKEAGFMDLLKWLTSRERVREIKVLKK